MSIIVLSSSTSPITRSRCARYAYQRYWNRRKVFEISRFPRSDAHARFGGEKTMLQRPEPLSPRSRRRSFLRALLSLFSLYLAGLLSSLFLFFISLSLPPARSLLAALWWKFFCMPLCRLISRNAVQCKPGMHCESNSLDNPTTSTTWRRLCTMISKLNWLYFRGCSLRNIPRINRSCTFDRYYWKCGRQDTIHYKNETFLYEEYINVLQKRKTVMSKNIGRNLKWPLIICRLS